MKNNLLFDFTVDKTTKTVFVNREFDAERSLVWDAFTKQEILDQWWAPKPWASKTKYMDFKVGGRRFYAMVSPEGQELWSIQDFTSISPITHFKFYSTFADKDENIDTEMPGSDWDLTFSEQNGKTKVSITIINESLVRMEQLIERGFKEGFTMALENLDQYIEAQFKLRMQNKTSNKARVVTYLNFPGNTEEAFLFYKSIFKTEFIGKGIERFGDIPAKPGNPTIPDEIRK